jgi:hypothetical protein
MLGDFVAERSLLLEILLRKILAAQPLSDAASPVSSTAGVDCRAIRAWTSKVTLLKVTLSRFESRSYRIGIS